MSHSLPRLTLTTSTSSLALTSPVFSTISPTHTRSLVHDPYLPFEVPRQTGGSTKNPSLTGYEPKAIETKAVETKTIETEAIGTEAIEPEDLEPKRIELGRNLGTDLYQIQERFMRNNYQKTYRRRYGLIRKSWCRDVLHPVTDAFRL